MDSTLKLKTTLRSNHKWYLFAICLLYAFSLKAQYSEQDLRREADQLFETRAYVQAMPLYSQLLSLNPTNPTYNYKYGASALYGDADKKEESIKYLRFASQKPGVDNEVWYFLGRAYHLNYLFDDAISAYEKYIQLAPLRDVQARQVNHGIEACRSGLGLLNHIKDITVLDKKSTTTDGFFRLYDLSDIGGKILVTPDALLSNLDKKNNHRSLIHYRGTGTTVYFSSYGRDGKNGLDIYRAEVLPNGEFSDPVALPSTINSPYDEDFPYMHPNGKTLFFSSKGHGSMGGYDIFRCDFNTATGTYSPPQNLDFAINTPDDDLFYVVDSLNGLANFSSSRSSPLGRLHVYRVEVESAPMDITFVKGDFINHLAPNVRSAKITVTDAATNEELTVQYSDPNSGEYVLSFPRGGRYKFLVEVKGGDRVHAGIVNIPKSTGMKAYLQEMELVSVGGTEKLLINNRFDQIFDGDVGALAQELLRQKAQLDVNFHQRTAKPESAPVVDAGKSNKDFERAFNEAGFGAGLSNRAIVEQAESRTAELEGQVSVLDDFSDKAAAKSASSLAEAREYLAQADELTRQAREGEASDAYAAMFHAGVAKHRARMALSESRNAAILHQNLENQKSTLQAKLHTRRAQTDSLRSAVDSGDYDLVLAAMKDEKRRRENEDRVAERFDPVKAVREVSITARNDARTALDRATSLRDASNRSESALHNAKRRRENAKPNELPDIDAEIARLTDDVETARNRTASAFENAEVLQTVADDENTRYELLAGFQEDTHDSPTATAGSDFDPWSQKANDEVHTALDAVDIDRTMVSTYLKGNPEAATEEFGDLAAVEFRKTFATAGTDVGELASENVKETQTSKEGDDLAMAGGDTRSKPEKGGETVDHRTQGEVLTEDKAGGVGESKKAVDGSEDDREISDGDLVPNLEIDKSDRATRDASTEAGEGEDTAMKSVESPNANEETNAGREGDSVSEQPSGPDSGGIVDLPDLDTPNSLSDSRPYDNDPAVPMEKRIKAERVKLASARDWMEIIEEAIDELQSGVGGGEDDDINDQLAQYRALRSEKIAEIEMREANIQHWQSEVDAADATVLQSAFNDVDTLDSSLISRLEMKIPEMAEDIGVMRDLREIDRNYLSELAAIELSGLSNPEIAERRIQLNEDLIADLTELIEGRSVTDIPQERLLELRRIMTLGIANDREVREGTMAYAPRTPEAREYRTLIRGADEVGDAEVAATTKQEPAAEPASENLSPKLAEDLSRPYARTTTLPGYQKEIARIDLETDPYLRHVRRASLNRDYLKALASDINLYKAALEATDQPNPHLQARYDKLLLERSKAVDDMNQDLAAMEAFEASEGEIASTGETDTSQVMAEHRVESYEKSSEAMTDANSDRIAAVEIKGPEYFQDKYLDKKHDIESRNLSDRDRIDSMAALNAEMAKDLDSEVERLIRVMDDPYSEVDRDSLQSVIAELDAIAADKRQEADRYHTQLESLALADLRDITTEPDRVDKTPVVTESQGVVDRYSPEEMESISHLTEVSVADGIEVRDIQYRSLNANIRRGVIENQLDNAEGIAALIDRDEEKLKSSRGATRDSLEQNIAANKLRLININEELIAGVEASNAEELAYYAAENKRLLDEISYSELPGRDSIGPENLSRGEVMAELDRLSASPLPISETDDRPASEKRDEVESDLARIEDMAILNEQLREKASELQAMEMKQAMAMAGAHEMDSELHTADESDVWAVARDPNSYVPIPEKTYLTPIHERFGEDLTTAKREKFIADEPALNIDLSFADASNVESSRNLLLAKSDVDKAGIDLLSETPNQFTYLTSAIRADSLKALETQSAAQAATWSGLAREMVNEADRLELAVENEQKERDKEELRRRASRIRTEAETLFQKSSIAAAQAEILRIERRRNEETYAHAALALTPEQRRALDDLLDGRSYAVVSSIPTLGDREVQENLVTEGDAKPQASSMAEHETADAARETVHGAATRVEPAKVEVVESDEAREPKVSEPAYEPILADASAANFIPEDLLAETGGNWLSVVDIIAEKDDFSDVRESMFVATGKEDVYSETNPIPLDPAMPQGLIFQVQVGAYRNSIPQDLFGEFAPVMGKELGNGITRYRAGLFKLYGQAAAARDKIRSKGYTDAFVVAYLNGEQLTGTEARDILAQARTEENYTPPSVDSKAAIEAPRSETAVLPDYYNDPEAAAATMVEATPGLFFTVQVGVYSKPVKLDQLYNLEHLNSELTAGGLIRYTTGRYASIEAATPKKLEARQKGVNDAFITAYYNGVRIPIDSARAVLEIQGDAVLTKGLSDKSEAGPNAADKPEKKTRKKDKADEGKYIVIMGRFSGDVPQELANLFLERPDLNIRRIDGPGGGAIYVSSELDSREDALEILETSRKAGVTTAVMGRMVDGQIREIVAE